MSARHRLALGTILIAASTLVAAQPLGRLRGRVVQQAGGPVAAAEVRVEVLFGFRGEDYTGQKTFQVESNAKGEWSLIAFRPGAWAFDAWAPGMLPDAVVLPFNIAMAPSSGVAGDTPPWHPVLRLAPAPETPAGANLNDAAEAARRGRAQAVAAALVPLENSSDPSVLVAAGRICLVLRDAGSARPFFRRALERDPQSFGAVLGMASTALMQRDFDAAARAFGDARKLTTDKDERSYLSAAINDLNKVHVTWNRTGP